MAEVKSIPQGIDLTIVRELSKLIFWDFYLGNPNHS